MLYCLQNSFIFKNHELSLDFVNPEYPEVETFSAHGEALEGYLDGNNDQANAPK